jgi:hypothetical protein
MVAKFQKPRGVSASSTDAQNLKFERADWTSFRTLDGLQQKAGVALNRLIRLVLKELADNALDTGAEVAVGEYDGGYFVEDEGPGLAPDEVARLFSIGRPLASTKMLRLPTRGALGNGLRVTAGAVLASDGKLAVISRGVRQELKPQRDGTTAVIERKASDRQIGTRIEISFGPALQPDLHGLIWANIAGRLAEGGSSYVGQSSPYWMAALAGGRVRSSPPPDSAASSATRSTLPRPPGYCARRAQWPSRSIRSGSARSDRKAFRAMPTPSHMARRGSARSRLRR